MSFRREKHKGKDDKPALVVAAGAENVQNLR